MADLERRRVGLPPIFFLYTLDQIANFLAVDVPSIQKRCYFVGRTNQRRTPMHITARNISPPEMAPDWRVSEEELIRYFKQIGYTHYRRKFYPEP